jgi:hypothetical protein
MAFTDFGIETLTNLVEMYKAGVFGGGVRKVDSSYLIRPPTKEACMEDRIRSGQRRSYLEEVRDAGHGGRVKSVRVCQTVNDQCYQE